MFTLDGDQLQIEEKQSNEYMQWYHSLPYRYASYKQFLIDPRQNQYAPTQASGSQQPHHSYHSQPPHPQSFQQQTPHFSQHQTPIPIILNNKLLTLIFLSYKLMPLIFTKIKPLTPNTRNLTSNQITFMNPNNHNIILARILTSVIMIYRS